MNSTPVSPSSIMRLMAFDPPPPKPRTLTWALPSDARSSDTEAAAIGLTDRTSLIDRSSRLGGRGRFPRNEHPGELGSRPREAHFPSRWESTRDLQPTSHVRRRGLRAPRTPPHSGLPRQRAAAPATARPDGKGRPQAAAGSGRSAEGRQAGRTSTPPARRGGTFPPTVGMIPVNSNQAACASAEASSAAR